MLHGVQCRLVTILERRGHGYVTLRSVIWSLVVWVIVVVGCRRNGLSRVTRMPRRRVVGRRIRIVLGLRLGHVVPFVSSRRPRGMMDVMRSW